MPIVATAGTAHLYNPNATLQQNLALGVIFEWRGGRGGEIGLLQGKYMSLMRSDPRIRWLLNFGFTTQADLALPTDTMRAHHVSDAAIKRKVVAWINAGMSLATLMEALEDVSSVNSLTVPDIIFPEKVGAVFMQWLVGWVEAAGVFFSATVGGPCWITLRAAEYLVSNMSTALANFRPGFGFTDGQGIAHAICPREATVPSLNIFNRALMYLAGFNSGNIALESFWVSARYTPTITAMGNAPLQVPTLGGFFGNGGGQLYSSERSALPGVLATIPPGNALVVPNAPQTQALGRVVKLRSGVVLVTSGAVTYAVVFYLLVPLFYTILQLFAATSDREL